MKYLEVALLIPPFKTYTYSIPSHLKSLKLKIGTRVIVPVKNRYVPGIIVGSCDISKVDFEVKDILMPLEKTPLFLKEHIEIFKEISNHLLVELGHLISSVIPSELLSLKLYLLNTNGEKYPLLDLAQNNKNTFLEMVKKWREDRVKLIVSTHQNMVVDISSPPPWPIRKNAKSQLNILEYIHVHGPTPKEELISYFGKNCTQVLSNLLKKGLVKIFPREDSHHVPISDKDIQSLNPTLEQEQVINSLLPYIEEKRLKISLLHGITGSGKTYVYASLMKKCLELNRNCILLIPEVALAESAYIEIKKLVPNVPIYLYHGYLPSQKRTKIFKQIAKENRKFIVVGTRSTIFLPIRNVGIIIIDEEHDPSYKQEERLKYHVRDVSYLMASMFNSVLLFGSATPDIKTYYAAITKKISLFEIKKRVKDRELPTINLINLNQDRPRYGPFSEKVFYEISSTIKRGEQVIILINRRGFSPIIFCTSCQEVITCPNCSVSMTYHKKIERLVCHYCGHSTPFPCLCPVCGSSSYVPLDLGTEQVEEFVTQHFGHKSLILRLDRDTYRKEKRHEDILRSFARGKYQILVGTQMCSKGHNFPGVTLVVVVDGDIGLNLPDYRATERTFQLLLQVAGRSGRGEKPGQVFIQTRNPNHYCWQYIKNSDYKNFFYHELERRKKLNYPPFSKLSLLRFEISNNLEDSPNIIGDIKNHIQRIKNKDITILGPAPAPIFILNKKKRYNCLIKAVEWKPIREFISTLLLKYPRQEKGFKISVDMDPYHML